MEVYQKEVGGKKKREEKQKIRTKMTVKEECRNKGENEKGGFSTRRIISNTSNMIFCVLILAGCHDYNTTC